MKGSKPTLCAREGVITAALAAGAVGGAQKAWLLVLGAGAVLGGRSTKGSECELTLGSGKSD